VIVELSTAWILATAGASPAWEPLPATAADNGSASSPGAIEMTPPPPALPLLPPPPPSLPEPRAPEAARGHFYWGLGLSGGVGYGARNNYSLPVAELGLNARFLIGQQIPDAAGGFFHAGLAGATLGLDAGTIIGSPSGSLWGGPFFMPRGGVDLAYQFLHFRAVDPLTRLQDALGFAVGWHLGARLIASYLAGNNAPATWVQSFDFADGPFVELDYPTYAPLSGVLSQKFVRLARIEAGGDAFYLLTIGSAF